MTSAMELPRLSLGSSWSLSLPLPTGTVKVDRSGPCDKAMKTLSTNPAPKRPEPHKSEQMAKRARPRPARILRAAIRAS